MAGKPGKSGGARPGAGRKPKPPEEKITLPAGDGQTPLEFMLMVMRDPAIEDRIRLDAAKSAAQYVHGKIGEGGKKDERQQAAKRAGAGKFGAAAPPRLVVNNK